MLLKTIQFPMSVDFTQAGGILGIVSGGIAVVSFIILLAVQFSTKSYKQPFASRVYPTAYEEVGLDSEDEDDDIYA
jgi:hypothetical protein